MMNFGRVAILAFLSTLAASSVIGCADAKEDDVASSESGIISRVSGSSLGSAYAKPGATYLSVRNIELLESVGALTEDMTRLAARVDGIIANQPADGRVSVQELLRMEQPGFIDTLFPTEKAALPKLWELLETTNDAPMNTSPIAALPGAIHPQDQSTPAGTLTLPGSLSMSEIPSNLLRAAQRIELTYDSDNDDNTITLADVNNAIATPGPYTPAEIAQFEEVARLFTEHAKSSISMRVDMPVPFVASKTLSSLGPSARLKIEDSLAIRETRSLSLGIRYVEGATRVTLQGLVDRKLSIETGPTEKVVAIFEDSEREQILNKSPISKVEAGVATFEVWSNGQRTAMTRVRFASELETTHQRVDLGPWVDYEMTAGGSPLFKNVLTTSQRADYSQHENYLAEYEYATTSQPAPADTNSRVLTKLATPTRHVVPGRYEVTVASVGTVRIDVSPSGAVFVTRMSAGATIKAYVHTWADGPKFHALFPDRLRVLLNGNTNRLEIFFDGRGVLFNGILRASDRTG